jgi:alpha/beta superfamily hydrolase
MNSATEHLNLQGAAGAIQIAIDRPSAPEGAAARGTAVLAHPHPLFGGTMDNKVVTTLARAAIASNLVAVRLNFRGVGGSAGVFDAGQGETMDLLQVCHWAFKQIPGLRVLGGFSFGAAVAANTHAALLRQENTQVPQSHAVDKLMLFGVAVSRFTVPPVPPNTLVVHGQMDDVVPLLSVQQWAKPQNLPVVVVPNASHFFDGRLSEVKQLAMDYLSR